MPITKVTVGDREGEVILHKNDGTLPLGSTVKYKNKWYLIIAASYNYTTKRKLTKRLVFTR